MSVKLLALALALLAHFCGIKGQRQPGVSLQISQLGLNYAGKVAVDLLAKNIHKQTIPNMSGTAGVVVGQVNYAISNVQIEDFIKPSSTVTVGPSSSLTWTLNNAGISVSGGWSYEYEVFLVKIGDSGSFDVTVSGASTTVSVTLSKLPNGKPTIRMLSCTCNIASVNVKFSGGASWLYNLFAGFVEEPLKNELEKQVCQAAEKTINVNAVAQLATLDTSVTLEKYFVLDYSLISNPLFASGYLQMSHRGEVFYITDRTPAPILAPTVSFTSPSRMVCAYVNQFVANSLGYVLHKNNVLRYQLKKSDIPQNGEFLSTKCPSGFCFGTLFPAAAAKYPDARVELNMTTNRAPVLAISSQGVTGTITGKIQVYTIPAKGKAGNLLALNITATLKVLVSAQGNRVIATVTQLTPSITVINSQIGSLQDSPLRQLLYFVANAFIIPKLNQVGQKGLAIPNVLGVSFVGPSLTLTQGAVVVCTAVRYNETSGR